jgi:DNA uptake protein ComE-like DNA-binding protein
MEWLRSYLAMSRRERQGALLLALLIASIWILPELFRRPALDPALTQKADEVLRSKEKDPAMIPRALRFEPFDPHTASDQQWLDMGLTERNLLTIRRYLARGGRFRRKEDLKKIYGLRPDLVDRMLPYVRISTAPNHHTSYDRESPGGIYPRSFPERPLYRRKDPIVIDLADADTSALIALPGIGSILARRIIQFREKCGGFHSVDQLAEVYGLQDSVFQRIRPMLRLEEGRVRKIRLNEASIDSLAAHPYITYAESRAIVKYREQHGPFASEAQLLLVALISEEWIRKLRPYLEFN